MRLIPRRVVYACAQYQSLRLERIGRNSSQTEVLQSPWIPETCSRHLLIFSSAKYNYMIWEMVEKKSSQKIENWAFK